MQELQVLEQNNELYVDSREVAEMVEKRHANLVRDIDNYQDVLCQNSKLSSDEYFVESNYQAGTGKQYKHYLLTKKGCDMVANKMTGEKGILFTATYVNAFHEMQNHIKEQSQLNVPKTPMQALRNDVQCTKRTRAI
jgi:Rha family phage regulatory protein